jgi:cell division protein FtsI (penicillin-binding protein 3)
VYLVYLAVLIFGIIIIARVAHIQFVEGDELKKKVEQNTLRYFPIDEIRGTILDCDGSILATSVPIFDIGMDLGTGYYDDEYFRENVDSLARNLSKLFMDKSRMEYKRLLEQGWEDKDRYLPLKRNVTYTQLKKMRRFPIFRLGRFKGGLVAVEKSKREIPFQQLAARTIGFERKGYKVGLEGGYSQYLEGVSGKRLMRKLSNGDWMPVSNKNEIEPKDGYDIVTTIDINIQDVAENALMRCLQQNEADHGCAILMEVQTGHIKAIANLTRMGNGSYQEVMNYALAEASEPGSTFKLMSLMVALEDEKIRITDTVDCGSGVYFFCNQQMRDHDGGLGRLSVKQIFEHSSNIGVSKIIYKSYIKEPEKFVDGLYRMGLNKSLEIDIPGEANPKIKSTKSKAWTDCYSLAWMSVGYELAITPMQTLNFYNAVANNGVMVKPMFVKEIRQSGQVIKSFSPEITNKAICSEKTIKSARAMLEGVVTNGTARNVLNAVYKIAGKTGTAQIANLSDGYDHENYKASFAGYFPADNPRYSCIVVVNNPSKGKIYGSAVAAPVFKEIADKVYATQLDIHQEKKNIPDSPDLPFANGGYQRDLQNIYTALSYQYTTPDASSVWVATISDSTGTSIQPRNFMEGSIPNVTGMSVKDGVYLLEKMGLKVRLSGKGVIRKQNPAAGTKYTTRTLVSLELASL